MARIFRAPNRHRPPGPWAKPRRRRFGGELGRRAAQVFLAFALGAVMAFAAIHYERGTFAAVVEPVRDAVLETMRDTPSLPHVVRGAPALSGSVTVVDGDTVRSGGEIYRLVGFNAPETGRNARCAGEDARGRAAAVRLRQLVDAGAVELRRLPCACATGTEGTNRCNFGRLCASLSADGRNVGAILISEGLAEPYHCSGTRCPPRRNWCG